MLFLRNCDGLNVSDKSFKILHLEDKKITLQDELQKDDDMTDFML